MGSKELVSLVFGDLQQPKAKFSSRPRFSINDCGITHLQGRIYAEARAHVRQANTPTPHEGGVLQEMLDGVHLQALILADLH